MSKCFQFLRCEYFLVSLVNWYIWVALFHHFMDLMNQDNNWQIKGWVHSFSSLSRVHLNSEISFPPSNHSSCSYWPLKDLLQMCFKWKWWRTKSTVCPHSHLKVDYSLYEVSAVWVSHIKWISDTFTIFVLSNSLFMFHHWAVVEL